MTCDWCGCPAVASERKWGGDPALGDRGGEIRLHACPAHVPALKRAIRSERSAMGRASGTNEQLFSAAKYQRKFES